MVMIWWAPNWQRPSKYLNFKTDGYTVKREREKEKRAALANILVTEKRQWNSSWKTLTKRNIWNYCRKMNLENQQKCHWANSFNSFFFICLCVQFLGSLETNWCKLYDVWWVQHEPAKMQLLFDLQEGRSGLRSKCSLFNYEENLQKQNTNQKKKHHKTKAAIHSIVAHLHAPDRLSYMLRPIMNINFAPNKKRVATFFYFFS